MEWTFLRLQIDNKCASRKRRPCLGIDPEVSIAIGGECSRHRSVISSETIVRLVIKHFISMNFGKSCKNSVSEKFFSFASLGLCLKRESVNTRAWPNESDSRQTLSESMRIIEFSRFHFDARLKSTNRESNPGEVRREFCSLRPFSRLIGSLQHSRPSFELCLIRRPYNYLIIDIMSAGLKSGWNVIWTGILPEY